MRIKVKLNQHSFVIEVPSYQTPFIDAVAQIDLWCDQHELDRPESFLFNLLTIHLTNETLMTTTLYNLGSALCPEEELMIIASYTPTNELISSLYALDPIRIKDVLERNKEIKLDEFKINDKLILIYLVERNSRDNTPATLKYLLEAGLNPNITDEKGNAPLLLVLNKSNFTRGALEFIKVLLENKKIPILPATLQKAAALLKEKLQFKDSFIDAGMRAENEYVYGTALSLVEQCLNPEAKYAVSKVTLMPKPNQKPGQSPESFSLSNCCTLL